MRRNYSTLPSRSAKNARKVSDVINFNIGQSEPLILSPFHARRNTSMRPLPRQHDDNKRPLENTVRAGGSHIRVSTGGGKWNVVRTTSGPQTGRQVQSQISDYRPAIERSQPEHRRDKASASQHSHRKKHHHHASTADSHRDEYRTQATIDLSPPGGNRTNYNDRLTEHRSHRGEDRSRRQHVHRTHHDEEEQEEPRIVERVSSSSVRKVNRQHHDGLSEDDVRRQNADDRARRDERRSLNRASTGRSSRRVDATSNAETRPPRADRRDVVDKTTQQAATRADVVDASSFDNHRTHKRLFRNEHHQNDPLNETDARVQLKRVGSARRTADTRFPDDKSIDDVTQSLEQIEYETKDLLCELGQLRSSIVAADHVTSNGGLVRVDQLREKLLKLKAKASQKDDGKSRSLMRSSDGYSTDQTLTRMNAISNTRTEPVDTRRTTTEGENSSTTRTDRKASLLQAVHREDKDENNNINNNGVMTREQIERIEMWRTRADWQDSDNSLHDLTRLRRADHDASDDDSNSASTVIDISSSSSNLNENDDSKKKDEEANKRQSAQFEYFFGLDVGGPASK